jgi:chromosome segregation ATPase
MAQRVTSFAKRPTAAAQQPVVDRTPLALPPEEVDPPDPIPLDLAPLAAPFRKRGRVTVRVERLPHRARLTQGQNNGDRSWSLALDELEGLAYLPPPGDDTQSLSIRIIRVDAGSAQTLLVREYQLPAATASDESPKRPASHDDAKELRALREELAKAQAALHVRDIELANARREAETARTSASREALEAELASMRAIWDAEVEERLALAAKQAAADLQKHRQEWQANADARVAQAEKRAKDRLGESSARMRQEIADALAQAEKEWKAAEAARLAEAEAKWQKQAAKALAEATAQYEKSRSKQRTETDRARADEAELARLRGELVHSKQMLEASEESLRKARAETDLLRQDSARLGGMDGELSKAREALLERDSEIRRLRAEADAARKDKSRLGGLNEDLAKARDSLSARDREVQKLRIELDALRAERAKLGGLDDELVQSKLALSDREGEIARIAAEADSLRKELERTKSAVAAGERELAQTRLKAEQLRTEADRLREDAKELRRVTTELSNVKASLTVRDAELARLRAKSDESRKRLREDADNALAEAEKRWKEAEAERLRDAEARWQAQSAKAISETVEKVHLAELRLEEEVERGLANAAEVGRLNAELARVRASLDEREGELVQARIAHEEARERWKQEAEAARAKAEAAWKNAESERLAASESSSREEAAIALAEMTKQVKKLETALGESRSQIEALRQRGNTDDFRRLRSEFASLQATLANREAELMQVRADHEVERERWTQEARQAVQRADQKWHEEDREEAEREQKAQKVRRIVGGAAVAAILGGLAMLGYFELAPMLADPTTPIGGMVEPIITQTNLALGVGQGASRPQAQAAPALTVGRSANMRSGPSTSAAVLLTLPRGTTVTLLDRTGNWVHVDAASAGGKRLQGWIYKTFLLGLPAAAPNPAPAARH